MNFANKISTFRILCVPFFVSCLIYYSPARESLRFVALMIFILAVVSDAVDGYIARKSRQVSEAGQILDPLGDKLLLMSAFICLSLANNLALKVPLWVALIVVSRDLIILLGVTVMYIVKGKIDIYPTRWGKLTTTFQMSAIMAVLLQLPFAFIFWVPTVFFTLMSGADYMMRGFKILYAVDDRRHKR
jgi:CDP-diacylglycerol--glycerol-3-phosphate 3-phosphatidyltransferase